MTLIHKLLNSLVKRTSQYIRLRHEADKLLELLEFSLRMPLSLEKKVGIQEIILREMEDYRNRRDTKEV